MMTKSISKILNIEWVGEIPDEEDSYVVRESYRLFYKELSDFTIEDTRFIIGQNSYLEITMPIAMNFLRNNLMAEGDFYPGDLLKNVLSCDSQYWKENKKLGRELICIYEEQFSLSEELEDMDDVVEEIETKYKWVKSLVKG